MSKPGVAYAKKELSKKLLARVNDELNKGCPVETLIELLNAAGNFLEKTQAIEVLELDELWTTDKKPGLLPVGESTIKLWARHPEGPFCRIGTRVICPAHLLFDWLSKPQNFADLSICKPA